MDHGIKIEITILIPFIWHQRLLSKDCRIDFSSKSDPLFLSFVSPTRYLHFLSNYIYRNERNRSLKNGQESITRYFISCFSLFYNSNFYNYKLITNNFLFEWHTPRYRDISSCRNKHSRHKML